MKERFSDTGRLRTFAHDLLDVIDEVERLRYTEDKLLILQQKYDELLMGSIRHSEQMVGGILKLAMTPGVMQAVHDNQEAKETKE